MFRTLTILAAIAALAVSAQPASAGSSNSKTILYNGHAGFITSGTADDHMKYPCDAPGFMDYTDDSCMAKSKDSGLKAGRNQVLHETAKAKAPRRRASLSGGIPDGTSNTLGIASTNVEPRPLSLNTFGGDDTL